MEKVRPNWQHIWIASSDSIEKVWLWNFEVLNCRSNCNYLWLQIVRLVACYVEHEQSWGVAIMNINNGGREEVRHAEPKRMRKLRWFWASRVYAYHEYCIGRAMNKRSNVGPVHKTRMSCHVDNDGFLSLSLSLTLPFLLFEISRASNVLLYGLPYFVVVVLMWPTLDNDDSPLMSVHQQ